MLKNLQSNVDDFGSPLSGPACSTAGAVRPRLLLCASATLLACAMAAAPASAQSTDTFTPFLSVGYNHDDNLFRLSDADKGSVQSSDNYRTLMGGLSVAWPVERQMINVTAKYSRVKFDKNTQLDYTGKDASGEWRWMLGNHFDGHIGASYLQVLAPFSDFHSSSERNLRVVRKQYADGNWRFHPSWQARAGYTQERYTYELQSQRINNRDEDSVMTGFDYLASSGSTVGLQVRRVKGKYPFQDALGLVSNGFTQDEQKINVLWLATGSTQVLFLGGLVQRKHEFYTERDDKGTNGRLIVSWAPEPYIKLNSQLYREFGVTEGTVINSALIKGITFGATWEATAKIRVVANYKHEEREFEPFSASGISVPDSQLSDKTNQTSVGVIYQPLRKLSLQASLFRHNRSGSVAAGTNTFSAGGASFNATLQF